MFVSLSAQDFSTWGEIYDYEVGDEFHFTHDIYEIILMHGYSYEWTINIEILNKEVAADSNSVVYTRHYKSFYTQTVPSGTYSLYYDYIDYKTYNNLDSLLIADSVYYGSSYNGRKQSIFHWGISYDEHIIDKYVEGCGHAYHDSWIWIIGGDHLRMEILDLVYYKKGDEEWGTPQIVVGLEENVKDEVGVWIYPNPAREKIHLSFSENVAIAEAKVYSQIGKEVLVVYTEFDNIDISQLKSGLYFVEVLTNKGRNVQKLIIQ